MSDDKAIARARKFFRRMADDGYGYIIRKKKKRIPLEEKIFEAQRSYWEGIKRAWRIYTEDDEIVKHAKEILDEAKRQANEVLDASEGLDQDWKLFYETICRAHDDYAETVASVWKAFKKDIKKKTYI